jgi:predicted branched-subunit amino acid permease
MNLICQKDIRPAIVEGMEFSLYAVFLILCMKICRGQRKSRYNVWDLALERGKCYDMKLCM